MAVPKKFAALAPYNTSQPPSFSDSFEVRNTSADEARFIFNDFDPPYLTIPKPYSIGASPFRTFIWWGGIEGFDLGGEATFGIHKHLGDNAPVVSITHLDEFRISLTGMFLGNTAPAQAFALRQLCIAPTPEKGKRLRLPYLLHDAHLVKVARYNFRRSPDARGLDIEYTVEFAMVGTENAPKPISPPATNPNPSTTNNRGKTGKHFKANDKYNTLVKIANLLFNNRTDKWNHLYGNNKDFFESRSVPRHQASTYLLPNGTSIFY